MSPRNRRNPDRTDASGAFGWDVIPGYYRVTASHADCSAATSRKPALSPLLTIPPAVLDLRLRLRCPHLHRARTNTRMKTGRGEITGTLLLAQVTTTRGHGPPTGVVTFRVGRQILGQAALDPRTGRSVLLTTRRVSVTNLHATYGGNGLFSPSRSP
jgi:hypothetical protein